MPLNQADAAKIIEKMLLIRLVEEEIILRYGAVGADQQMRCPVHLSIGQEAAAVGACHHLVRPQLLKTAQLLYLDYL